MHVFNFANKMNLRNAIKNLKKLKTKKKGKTHLQK